MSNKKLNKKLLLARIVAVAVFALPIIVYADTYTLLAPLAVPGGGALAGGSDGKKIANLAQYLQAAFQIVVGIAGLIAVTILIIGGIEYVSSGISGNESARTDAHKRIWDAITGLVLAVTGFLILQTINPDLVNFELTIQKISVGGGVGGEGPSAADGLPTLNNSNFSSPVAPTIVRQQLPNITNNIGDDNRAGLALLEKQLCGSDPYCLFTVSTTPNATDPSKPDISIAATQKINQALLEYAAANSSAPTNFNPNPNADLTNIPYGQTPTNPSKGDYVVVQEEMYRGDTLGHRSELKPARFEYDGTKWNVTNL